MSHKFKMMKSLLYVFLLVQLCFSVVIADEPCDDIFASIGPPGKKVALGKNDEWWVFYDCNTCGREQVPALPSAGVTRCVGCGHPKTTEKFYQSAEQGANGTWYVDERLLVTDEHLNTLANAPEFANVRTWSCTSCSTKNFPGISNCLSCGAARVTQQAGGLRDSVSLPPDAGQVRLNVTPSAGREVAQGAGRDNPPGPQAAPAESGSGVNPLLIGGGVVAAGAAGYGLYWGMSTKNTEGEVLKTTWRHSEVIERFTKTSRRDWRFSIRERQPVMPRNGGGESPGAFNIRNCRDEHYEWEPYVCGTETVHYEDCDYVPDGEDCNPEINQSTGTSQMVCTPKTKRVCVPKTKEVDKICQRSIEKSKCDYDTYYWNSINRQIIGGENPPKNEPLPWPGLPLGEHDRVIRRSDYAVIFTYQSGEETLTHEDSLNSTTELHSWQKGDPVILHKRNFGGISGYERPQ